MHMIYEGRFKLSTDSTAMIDHILNSECICMFSFKMTGKKNMANVLISILFVHNFRADEKYNMRMIHLN